ncbi:transposase [Clostridium sp. BL-8]|uniref:IS701 family transposase n=1 Tax=Clostridium sp. BL-8 TaxID=349938 RepID=UPI00098C84B5|nr:transposase [Clostridium sp. BL-8]OOM78839.1 transposase DDE domain protein [Clostridium sp. BL-8]
MNSIGSNSTINTLKKYLNAYKSIFYKRSFENFQILIFSIFYMQEVKSIKLIYDKFIKKYWNVCVAIAIPILHNHKIKYIKFPIQYRIYDKSRTKLELASEMILSVAPALAEYQVIVTCDSWYTKKPFISEIEKFSNIHIIGALRSDTAMFEVNFEKHTGKKGCPRKKGNKINYRNLKYTKEGKFFIAYTKAKINLTNKNVCITVTTTDIENFKSVRIYMSTINPNKIRSFDNVPSEDKPELDKSIYNIYKIRWNIEVIFYQQKTFCSFSNYMVRSKCAIEKYVNLLGVAYSMCIMLPFITDKFSYYKLQSPQELKYYLSECIIKELFFDKLLETLQSVKNIITFKDVINCFASQDEVR